MSQHSHDASSPSRGYRGERRKTKRSYTEQEISLHPSEDEFGSEGVDQVSLENELSPYIVVESGSEGSFPLSKSTSERQSKRRYRGGEHSAPSQLRKSHTLPVKSSRSRSRSPFESEKRVVKRIRLSPAPRDTEQHHHHKDRARPKHSREEYKSRHETRPEPGYRDRHSRERRRSPVRKRIEERARAPRERGERRQRPRQREEDTVLKIQELIKDIEESSDDSSDSEANTNKASVMEAKSNPQAHSPDSSVSSTSLSPVEPTSPQKEQEKVPETSKSPSGSEGEVRSPEDSNADSANPFVIRSRFDDSSGQSEESDVDEAPAQPMYEDLPTEEASEGSPVSSPQQPEQVLPSPPQESPEKTPEPELPPYLPALMGCKNVESYEWLDRIEEGTYGVVYKAKDKRTGEIVALKKLKMEKEKEGFPITSLREINMLLKAAHPNIVPVREIVVGSNMDKIYIVMDFIKHDLKALMSTMKEKFLEGEVKTLMIHLLSAVHHMHDNWILHRDLKTSNLLLSHDNVLKVADFGLAREYGSPLLNYTPIVVTLWYRSPELLLGAKEYSTAVDVWSAGCIFAELLLHKPLFSGKSEIDQLNKIFSELGTPNEKIWPGFKQLSGAKNVTFTHHPQGNLRKKRPQLTTNNGFDLLFKLLTYDPKARISAKDALDHPYFKEMPRPVPTQMFPTWPTKSEIAKSKAKRERSPTPPEGGAEFVLKGGIEPTSPGPGFSLKF